MRSVSNPGPGLIVVGALSAMTLLLAPGCSRGPGLSEDQREALLAGLREAGATPDDYLVSTFADHDVVVVGEHQLIAEDVSFVARVIPKLYHEAGVRAVAVEYLCAEDQAVIDSLVTTLEFNRAAAAEFQGHYMGGIWPYQDYLEVYTAVWSVNRSLPAGAERMRLIGISPTIDWETINHGTEEAAGAERRRVALADQFMAGVVDREIIAQGLKGLVYCGMSHAFSSFREPIVHDGEFVRLDDSRMGNLLKGRLGDRMMTVLLHSPWPGERPGQLVSPCDGILDAALTAHADSVGFNTAGTPMGQLPVTRSEFRIGHDGLTLAGLCDGYVFQRPIARLTGVSVMGNWFRSEEDLAAARRRFPDPAWAERLTTPTEAVDAFRREAGVQVKFREVQ